MRKAPPLLLAWKGRASINGTKLIGDDLNADELFVTYEGAVEHEIVNEGKEELILYKIFGPDVYG